MAHQIVELSNDEKNIAKELSKYSNDVQIAFEHGYFEISFFGIKSDIFADHENVCEYHESTHFSQVMPFASFPAFFEKRMEFFKQQQIC